MVSAPPEGRPYSSDARAWPRGAAGELSSGPRVKFSENVRFRAVLALPAVWFCGYCRYSKPNLKSCFPWILSKVTEPLRVSVPLYSHVRGARLVYPVVAMAGNRWNCGLIAFSTYAGIPRLVI